MKRILTLPDCRSLLNVLYSFGMRRGSSTGWKCVDEHYTVAPGQLTVVTGWPGSGKSEWVDALLVNLARGDWRFAVYSPENHPIEVHAAKIMEKWVGMPFGEGPTQRMSYPEVLVAEEQIGARFGFIAPPEEAPLKAEDVLDAAGEYFLRFGDEPIKRGVVIDPWNELDHLRPADLSETEYISRVLSYVRGWARNWKAHVWLVAHPAKQRREEGKLPVPRPDMIAGSQHWWNKADNCITVWRDYDAQTQEVDIHVQKVRFKHIGRIGATTLNYDRVTGRYWEPRREGNVIYSMVDAA